MVQAVTAPPAPQKLETSAVGMRVVTAGDLSQAQLSSLTARPRIDFASVLDTVRWLHLLQAVVQRQAYGSALRVGLNLHSQ